MSVALIRPTVIDRRYRLFPPLFLDQMTQLAFHRFKGVMDDFGERFVRAVVSLFLVGDELVAA